MTVNITPPTETKDVWTQDGDRSWRLHDLAAIRFSDLTNNIFLTVTMFGQDDPLGKDVHLSTAAKLEEVMTEIAGTGQAQDFCIFLFGAAAKTIDALKARRNKVSMITNPTTNEPLSAIVVPRVGPLLTEVQMAEQKDQQA